MKFLSNEMLLLYNITLPYMLIKNEQHENTKCIKWWPLIIVTSVSGI